jgi:hypothetical protein
MKKTFPTTLAVLALTLLITGASAAVATADDSLPVQIGRSWAQDGDLIGLENHWAAGFTALDQYGSDSKSLEDWQLGEQYSGTGLFTYRKAIGEDMRLFVSGYGTNQDGLDLAGRFHFKANCIGIRTLKINHRGYNYFSDATSEMRSATFAAGPIPMALDAETGMSWCRNDISLRYHLTSKVDVNLGFLRSKRMGDKGSLLRTGTGSSVPGLKSFDTDMKGFWWGGALALGNLATDLQMSYRVSEGQRNLDDRHLTTDDQKLFSTRIKATYDIDAKTRVMGNYTNSNLESDGVETVASSTYTPSTKATTNAGHLGLIRKLGTASTVSVSANLRSQTVESRSDLDGVAAQFTDRDRTSQDYRVALRHTGLAKTKLDAYYRYNSSDLDGVTTAGVNVTGDAVSGDSQTTVAEKTRQEMGFKGRYRFNKKATLKARLVWRSEEVTQTETWDTTGDEPWFYWMGDRTTDQLRWRLSLQTRPRRGLGLDIGHQAIDQKFERQGTVVSETSWNTQRAYTAANWRLHERLTVHGNVSLGVDTFEMTDGPTSDGALGNLTYDGTTWRFAPGAVIQVTKKLQFEALYEGVRFEDKGDDPAELTMLNTDYDRTTLRARYRMMQKASLAASYRRYEFDENRWDDTINDLYTLSVSGSF